MLLKIVGFFVKGLGFRNRAVFQLGVTKGTVICEKKKVVMLSFACVAGVCFCTYVRLAWCLWWYFRLQVAAGSCACEA